MKAIWNDTVVVEGNHYFPSESLKQQFFKDSLNTTACPWKGTALYCSVVVDHKEAIDAAWYYPKPKTAANHISGKYAFWRGVEIVESESS